MPPRGDVEAVCPPLPFLWLRPFPAGFGQASDRMEGPLWGPRWLTQSWAAGTLSGVPRIPPGLPSVLLLPAPEQASQSTWASAGWQVEAEEGGGWAPPRLSLWDPAGLSTSVSWANPLQVSLLWLTLFPALPFSPPHFQSLSTGSWLALRFGVLSVSFLLARPLPVSQGKPRRDLFSVCLSSELLVGS